MVKGFQLKIYNGLFGLKRPKEISRLLFFEKPVVLIRQHYFSRGTWAALFGLDNKW
jgi:hypothetical protein